MGISVKKLEYFLRWSLLYHIIMHEIFAPPDRKDGTLFKVIREI